MNSGMSFGPILPQWTAASAMVQPGIRMSTRPLRAETVGIGSPGMFVAQPSDALKPQASSMEMPQPSVIRAGLPSPVIRTGGRTSTLLAPSTRTS